MLYFCRNRCCCREGFRQEGHCDTRHYAARNHHFQRKRRFHIRAPNVVVRSRTEPMSKSAAEMETPYREALTGILSFSTLSEAEETIQRLESLRRKYQSAGDRKGEEYCRRIALLGRRRAELISRNNRVKAGKRRQKQEIAVWFRIWLETPEIFENWLALRKETEEFQEIAQTEK